MDTHQTTSLLVGLAAMVLLARALGVLARRLGQPAVIGEVLAGIALGPTLFHGAISDALFPGDIRPLLSALAAVGVAVFMFIVGLEWDAAMIRGSGSLAATVSFSSILLPFGAGSLLALYLMDDYGTGDKTAFMLFMGIAMSITAFPVLARILTDRRMTRTPLGVVALACASIDDVLAWSLLAGVVAISGSAGPDQWRILLAVPYLAGMLFAVRPLLQRYAARRPGLRLTPGVLASILAGLLLSGAITEWVGLHYIFGAFLFGMVLPRTGTERLREEVHEQLGQMNGTLLLPVFFLVAGLKVDLSGLDAAGLGALALILLVAVGGKFTGAFVAARLNRMPVKQSAALATLMNTRGLTELIVLNVGLQLGFIGKDLYSLMVVMAVTTTAMAGPLLTALIGRPKLTLAPAEQQPATESVRTAA
ncbi:cation:proton antiporter domain-containing protein [Streptomyces justiciae]|uniref:cation:proton antiporter domain-containing protein n=1 Tax=Streptomyces justiciae TaxID=2780140 RepID=UPI0018828806|nr:cation:proton antiporter [Streptomyces justiciae]MBE8478432.1 cation:proton antiporter [Streptomyces justiciae]MCW8384176.1 cation:proton antiporter [Streptomyces justiciae]